jgi:MFS family permease
VNRVFVGIHEPTALPRRAAARSRHRLERAIGGSEHARMVVLFAAALALESADLTTIGALGPQLQSHLHVSDTELGLLATVSTFVGAVMTVPFGVLADRVRRVDLLAGSIFVWAIAMAASAAAQSYGWLLLSRVGLGAVTAAAVPAIASMTGDSFEPAERGRIYGYILSGELIGAGFGFVVSGGIGSALSWRWGFGVMAIPALLLAVAIWRGLDEPARSMRACAGDAGQGDDVARRAVASAGAQPDPTRVLRGDPVHMNLAQVIRYVLSIPTNRWLIVASSVGYFFFAGLRTFAVVFVRGHYGLSQGSAIAVLVLAGIGSVAGVLIAGRVADRQMRRGRATARILVGALFYILAAVTLLPAVLVGSLAIAIPFLILAGAGLSAPNPPLDAARLDIMPGQLWGRAEGVRTFLRQSAQAGAPLLFGLLAEGLGGTHGNVLASGSAQEVSAATARGLQYAFALMLIPLLLNGILLLFVPRRAYPSDVATAATIERAIARRARPRRGGASACADTARPRRQLIYPE